MRIYPKLTDAQRKANRMMGGGRKAKPMPVSCFVCRFSVVSSGGVTCKQGVTPCSSDGCLKFRDCRVGVSE